MAEERSMISVVIPLYNKEQSIRSTLQSVLAQTYTDYEIVVVDDGSTDKSAEVVESLVKSLTPSFVHSIRLIHQPNGGVSSARNTGIMAAKGEYIAFLDGDDLWDMDFLKEMSRLINEFPGRSIYGLGCEQRQRNEQKTHKESYYRGEAKWDYDTMAFTGSSACVNRTDAIAAGLFDTRMTHGEDLDMWWRLMLLHGGVSDMRPYAYYVQDAENRAMHKTIALEKHIPYYMDKFAEARANNVDFRRFFDREMIYRLYQYLFIPESAPATRQLAKKIDYSLQKRSMKWRMQFPYLYRLYLAILSRDFQQF